MDYWASPLYLASGLTLTQDESISRLLTDIGKDSRFIRSLSGYSPVRSIYEEHYTLEDARKALFSRLAGSEMRSIDIGADFDPNAPIFFISGGKSGEYLEAVCGLDRGFQKIQQQLNRGEARHQLAKHLFFANQGEFRDGDYEEMMNKASCLSLLLNAVLVANTHAIDRVIRTHPDAKEVLTVADLARISPMLFRRIMPNGTYHFRGHG